MGSVCRKHEEFYIEACRWCEPAKAAEVPAAPPVPTSANPWGGNLNNQAAAQQNVASGGITGGLYRPPRQPGSCACGVYVLGSPAAHIVDHHRIHHSIAKCVLVLP